MTRPAGPRWRRGMFLHAIVHLIDPDTRIMVIRKRHVMATLCGRFALLDSWEDAYTHRCPDCAHLDNGAGGELPASGGGAGPAASLG